MFEQFMGIRIYLNSFSNPKYYLYLYLLKVDLMNNIRICIRVKISIRYNTDLKAWLKSNPYSISPVYKAD